MEALQFPISPTEASLVRVTEGLKETSRDCDPGCLLSCPLNQIYGELSLLLINASR